MIKYISLTQKQMLMNIRASAEENTLISSTAFLTSFIVGEVANFAETPKHFAELG